MGSYEDQILNVMELYYFSVEKALEWYDRPHNLLSNGQRRESPREMVASGKGKEVLGYIKTVLDTK